jgi:diguanylate cyclase (GGDEF)-like protein
MAFKAHSLTRIHLQAILVTLLCLAAIGYLGHLAARDMRLSFQQAGAAQTAGEVAARINLLIGQQRQALEKLAHQPTVAAALQRGTTPERIRKQEEIKSLLSGAVAVHLLTRSSAGEWSAATELDAACLEYIRRAAAANAPAAPEFHGPDTPAAHYDLVVPVMDENRNLHGYLLAAFDPAPLQAIFEQSLPRNAYMELQQSRNREAAQAVLTAGEVANNTGASVTSTLGDSRWTLLYQPAETSSALLSGRAPYYLAAILVLAGAVLVVLLRLYRQTVTAVRHDIKSLIRMFRDLREGSVRVGYPMALGEFAEIFDYLRDRGQKLVAEKEKMKNMGLLDHLSQLNNRRYFEERLKELFDASRANGPSSVLIMDMDHFKQVNDNHGHDAGDALIVGFANALRKVVRQTDVLARLGGDEFCIIYAFAPLDKAKVLVDRLRRQLPREIPLTKGVIHRLRWTGGLSAMHDNDTKPDDVLWRADQALLQAKEGGRNITKVYDPATGAPEKKRVIVS